MTRRFACRDRKDVIVDLIAEAVGHLIERIDRLAGLGWQCGSGSGNYREEDDAVPHVVMAAALRLARLHRENRLAAVQCLDLRLLVDTQHDRVARRRHVEPNHIAYLGHEVRVGRKLEALLPVRLQAERPPYALHRRGRKTAARRHATGTPMRRAFRLAFQRGHSMRASSMVRGAPERGSSRKPSQR
jgi:hypothetical protein